MQIICVHDGCRGNHDLSFTLLSSPMGESPSGECVCFPGFRTRKSKMISLEHQSFIPQALHLRLCASGHASTEPSMGQMARCFRKQQKQEGAEVV